MKKLSLMAILTGLMLVSMNSNALISRCDAGPDYDGFYHRATLGVLEYSFPYVRTWMETHVDGPVSPSLYSLFYNTLNSWHFFIDMPPGNYHWSGYAVSEVSDYDYFWQFLDVSLCSGQVSIVPPPFCENTELQVTGSTTLTSNIHNYLVSAVKGGFEAVEKLGVCSNTGTPSFSGSLILEHVSQCCEVTDSFESTTRATGAANFSVPSLSCTLKQIIVPSYGIVLEGSVTAGASAGLGYSGMNKAMCGADAPPITLSGTINGGFGGEIGVGGISTRIVGAGVELSETFSIKATGPDVYNLALTGCIGPAEISGWVRFLGTELKTQIVPQEWVEGTTLCL